MNLIHFYKRLYSQKFSIKDQCPKSGFICHPSLGCTQWNVWFFFLLNSYLLKSAQVPKRPATQLGKLMTYSHKLAHGTSYEPSQRSITFQSNSEHNPDLTSSSGSSSTKMATAVSHGSWPAARGWDICPLPLGKAPLATKSCYFASYELHSPMSGCPSNGRG